MFENYISLYQLFFNIIPVLGSAVLVFIRIPERLKLVVASFLATYCSYLCPLPSVLAFFLFCCLLIEPAHNLISEASAKSDYKKVVLIKLLSTIFAIVSAVFLLLNTILLRKYSSGWAINIGHVFLFASIMWGFIALYLV